MSVEHAWVEDDRDFTQVVDALAAAPLYGIDTEFHRERTYWPRLALLQVAWPGGVAVVDPLAVDIAPLARVLAGGGTAVLHAGEQDLEVLDQACGRLPARLFDTQIAARFLGFANPALATLCQRLLGVRVPKGDRLTDWLRRPLTPAQRAYAAADVAHLLDLHRLLEARLAEVGRLEWAEAEMEQLRVRPPRSGQDPADAWQRIKEARQLRGSARGVAAAVAAWRERRARELDQPPRFVLSDLAVVGVANRRPTSPGELEAIRGVDRRHLRGGAERELLDAVGAGLELDTRSLRVADRDQLDPALRPAVTLVSAWVSQLARHLSIDTSLLATRADLTAFLRGDDDARLAQGWRAELVGEPVRRLVEGRAALAFDGDGELVLERRSGDPLAVELPSGEQALG